MIENYKTREWKIGLGFLRTVFRIGIKEMGMQHRIIQKRNQLNRLGIAFILMLAMLVQGIPSWSQQASDSTNDEQATQTDSDDANPELNMPRIRLEIARLGKDIIDGEYRWHGRLDLTVKLKGDFTPRSWLDNSSIIERSGFPDFDRRILRIFRLFIGTLPEGSDSMLALIIKEINVEVHVDEEQVQVAYTLHSYDAFRARAMWAFFANSIDQLRLRNDLTQDTQLVLEHLTLDYSPDTYHCTVHIDIPRSKMDPVVESLYQQYGRR
jgi:hypothetical protein